MSILRSFESSFSRRLGALTAPRSGSTLVQGVVGMVLLAASMPSMAALSQSQVLSAIDHTVDAPLNIVDDRFGEAVAVSGNWMAVGSPAALDAQGTVSIYERVSGAWVWRQRVTEPAAQSGSGFGSAVDIHEAGGLVTLIVGAPLFDTAQTNQGRAYVFTDNDAGAAVAFASIVTVNLPTPEANARFGASVALFGDIAAIGAPDAGATDNGLVSIRGRNVGGANSWGQTGAPKTGPLGTRFGTAVDVHGEYLIVGAPMAQNVAALRGGAAYVYRQDLDGSNAFGLKHTLFPSAGQDGHAFGHSVGVWDSNLAVADSTSRTVIGGPRYDDGSFIDAGRVTFFGDATNQGQFTGSNANSQYGFSVAIEGDNAIASRPTEIVSGQSNAGQVNTFTFNGTIWVTNTINLTESGANRNHFFGRSVDISGTNAVIGTPGTLADPLNAPPGAARAGSITTLVKPGVTWTFESKRLAIYDQPFSQIDQFFGFSTAITGDWMAVGAQNDAQKGATAGAVFMYRRVGGVWTPHSKLTALYGKLGDQFGSAVTLQGGRLVVGAPGADGFPVATTNAGAVYVFDFNGTAWVQTIERQSPNPTVDGRFGVAVSLHGDVLAVGASGENGNIGRAYAFRNLADLSSPITLNVVASVGSGVGRAISVYDPATGTPNDETIAIGAFANNAGGAGSGAAFVLSGPTFATVTTLVNPAPGTNRFFGYSVSLFNGRVAVGAPTASVAPSGTAHVFSGVGYTSVETLAPTGSPGQFGFSVALSDTELLVGSPASNGRAGTAHRFLRSGSTWAQTDLLQPADLAAVDEFGSNVALAGGSYVVGAPLRDSVVNNSGVAYVFQQAPEVTVLPASLSVSEAGPTSQTFAVSLNQAPGSNVTIELTFPPQVQVDTGAGFGASPQTVTLTPANAISGVTVSVQAVDDAIAEANPHAATVTTSVTTSADSQFNGLAVDDVAVSIADNDSPVIVVTQSDGSTSVTEGGATDSYTVVLGSQPAANVTVNLSFDAQLEVRVGAGPFASSPASIVFTPASATTPQTVTVRAADDTVVEGAHGSTIVQTTDSADPLYAAINPADVTVGITDNDSAQVVFAAAGSSTAEAAGTHSVTARLQIVANGTPGGTLGLPVQVTPSLTAGTADAGDFGAVTPSYSFLAGAAHNATETVSVVITNDRLLEGAETFALSQTVSSGPAIASGTHVVTITDDESAAIAWTAASGNAAEATPAYTGATAQLTVSGSGSGPLQLASGNSVSVAVNALAGTADAADYTVGSSVVFAGGSASGATQVAAVTVVNDALVEGDEGFQVQFGAATGAGALSAAGTHAVTIADNDSAVIGFAPGDDTVGEADGSFSKPVVLTLTTNGTGSAALQRAVEVPVGSTPQTASTPADYTLTTPSVGFAAGAVNGASQTATITLVDDAATETVETLLLTIGDSFVTSAITRGRASTQVTITDNDTPGVTVTQSGGSTAVSEAGATDTYTLVLNTQPSANVTVTVSADAQLTTAPTQLTFTPVNWNTAQTVTVTAVDDALAEGTHTGALTHAVTSPDTAYNGLTVAGVTASITDNDEAGVILTESGGSTSVAEGGATDTYTLVLSSQPTADVVVAINPNAQLSTAPTSVTFTSVNWNVARTVTVSAVDDAVVEGAHDGIVDHVVTSADAAFDGAEVTVVEVSIADNDAAGVTVTQSGGTTTVTEGGTTDTYTLVLTSQPTADVTVAINPNAQLTTAPTSVTFTSANWNVARTVTVTAVDDAIAEGSHSGSIGHAVTSADATYNGVSVAGVTVTITDNDNAGVTVTPTTGLVTTESGGTATFTVVLNTQPVANVSIGLSSSDTGEGTVLPTSLTFTAANWSVAQTVTVTGVDDLIVDGNVGYTIVTAAATSTDPAYASFNAADVSVSNTDNDVPGMTVTPTIGLVTTEAGGTATFTVVLNTQPSADVSIGLSSSDTSEGTVSPTSLTFTTANWNVAQTVTVTGVDDLIVDGNVGYTIVTAPATSADPAYAGFNAADVGVSNTDNDVAGVTVTQSGGNTAVTEGGATDTYTLVLTSQPTADVTVAINPNAQLTTAPTSVLFTSANWNVAQTVTVSAVDDVVVEGSHGGSIAHAVTSADASYNGVSVAGVTATITDNDNAGVVLTQSGGSTAVTEGGATDTYTLVLTSQPTANVTVAINPNAQLTTAPTSVIFTSANWNVAQVVTVSAVDDAVVEGSHSGSIGHTVTSTDATYNGVSVAGVTATITDNDNAGVTVAQSGGNTAVIEGGATDTYTLVLTSQPTANVTVAISPNAQLTTAPTSVLFTSANWNVAQTVTVTAVDDAIAEGTHSGSVSHTVTSADGNYNGVSVAGVTATITDNDNPGVTVTPSGGSTAVAEGGATDTYTLVLATQPTADVTVAIAGGTQLTTSPPSVTFTSANWNAAQTVTVTAVDDALAEGTHSGSVTHTLTSADAAYQGRLVDTVSVTITDNDAAGVQVTESGGNTATTEGGATDTISVVLSSQPLSNVTVTVTPNAQVTASPSPLTFTSANWNVAQVVTVTAADDAVVEGNHSGTLGFGVASTDPAYGSVTLPSITAAVTDNDSAVVSFAPASVSQSEATSPMVYTVTLSNPVASGVTVKVNSTNGTATAGADYTAVVDQTVTFAANSTTAQTVSVAISNDALDEDNETYTLTLSALSATGDVTLGTATATGTIEDDDALPTLSVANVTQPEGNAVNTLTFTVNLTPASGRAVSFTRATVDGSAVSTGPDADFVAIAGSTVTIPAGQTSLTIPVTINGDATFEGDEQFTLSLTDIANANVGGTTIAGTTTGLSATATLLEDDQQPTTTTITADLPDPSVVGQPYPVTVEVRGQTLSPLGTVSITDGTGASCTAPLTAGTVPVSTMTCALTSTSAGAKTLTASYTPASSAFGASSDTEAHTVNGAATSLTLLGPARARIGTAATYTAELSVTAPGTGTPAGTVTVSAGTSSCTITLPTATPSCTISYSSLGSRTVTAVFAPGNSDYTGSTSNPVQTLVFASADLSVTKTNAVNTYRPGDLLVYTVVVRNTGPDAAPQVRVRDVAPAGLTNVAWTCEASGGAVCPDAGGTGTLDHVVETLPSTGVLTYAYFGNVIGRPLSIVNVAEVTLPADTTIEDPNLENNSASDTDLLDDLFADGFEAPGINSESGSVRLAGASLRSTSDEIARVTVRLSDVRGEALRVYARVVGGELQVALALRGADGALRLGSWQKPVGEPELTWTATPTAGGFVLNGATLR